MSERDMKWVDVPYVVDDAITELFEMPTPDKDPEQKPVFHVTSSTADLVAQDFELYEPSLERMVNDWKEAKERVMQELASAEKGGAR